MRSSPRRLAVLAALVLAGSTSSCFFSSEASPDCCQCMIDQGAYGCSAVQTEQDCLDECCSAALCCKAVRLSGCEQHCSSCKSSGACAQP